MQFQSAAVFDDQGVEPDIFITGAVQGSFALFVRFKVYSLPQDPQRTPSSVLLVEEKNHELQYLPDFGDFGAAELGYGTYTSGSTSCHRRCCQTILICLDATRYATNRHKLPGATASG